jgi:hypothetical protein
MQLRDVLADRLRKDTLIAAGTGSGKTLPIALNILLDVIKCQWFGADFRRGKGPRRIGGWFHGEEKSRVASRRVFLVTVDAAELPSNAKLMYFLGPSMVLDLSSELQTERGEGT